MTIPSIPTDNLYKFIAISGVVLALFSYGFATTEIGALEDRVEQLHFEVDSVRAEAAYLEEYADSVELSGRESGLDYTRRIAELTQRRYILPTKLAAIQRLLERVEETAMNAVIGTGVGSGLAWVGFALWYKNVQRYLDAVLRAQAFGKAVSSAPPALARRRPRRFRARWTSRRLR